MNTTLKEFIRTEILPQYAAFDKAHREDHARMVIEQSLELARHNDVDEDMVLAIAAYHELGISVVR